MIYPCINFALLSERFLRGRKYGAGEENQEIVNSSSPWSTPPSHTRAKGQQGAERDGEPAGVLWPWSNPQRSPLAPTFSVLILIPTQNHVRQSGYNISAAFTVAHIFLMRPTQANTERTIMTTCNFDSKAHDASQPSVCVRSFRRIKHTSRKLAFLHSTSCNRPCTLPSSLASFPLCRNNDI